MKQGDYVDLVLMKGDEGERILGVAPSFSHFKEGDRAEIEVNGERHNVAVVASVTVNYLCEDYDFAALCYGEDPEKVKVVSRFYKNELKWEEEEA